MPALLAVVIFLALGGSEAGFYPIGSRQHPGLGWYPAALLLLALLAAAAIAAGRPRRVPRPVLVALALLGGYTAWSYLSIAWAEQQGVAWDGANRTAIYLLVLALFALWPLSARAGLVVLGALGLGIAGLGLWELLAADRARDPTQYFVDARFAEPAGYINANVALWTLGLWPCLHLASARAVNPLVRGLALGGAGILVCLALMGQSRGWVFAVPLAALLFFALMPDRARALAALVAVAVGVFLVSGRLLAVHNSFTPESFDGLLAEATTAILVLAAVLVLAGAVVGLADRRTRLSVERARAVNRGAVAALGVVLLLGAGVAAVRAGDPVEKLGDSWETFKTGGEGRGAGGSRFASVGTNRYDFWTVAWDRFRERPVTGIGSENFQQDYLARGNSGEQPRYPHSLVLGVLSQTGLVGALLLAGALIAACTAALRVRRRSPPEAAAVAGAAGAVFAYWLLHASVDWFWEFPGLTAPAFAMLGLATAIAPGGRRAGGEERTAALAATEAEPVSGPDRGPRRRLRLPALPRLPDAVPIAAAGVVAAALSTRLVLPWLAEREIDRAASEWTSAPTAAFARLERAEAFNPLSPKPHLVAATIAVRVEDEVRATRELEEVLRIEPRTPFALAELAALASERGQQALSRRLLARATGHAPRDDVVTEALEQVRSGRRLDVRELNASYIETARERIGRE